MVKGVVKIMIVVVMVLSCKYPKMTDNHKDHERQKTGDTELHGSSDGAKPFLLIMKNGV